MFELLPKDMLSWSALFSLLLVGVFAVIGILDKVKKQRQDDSNKVDDRLIKLLKDQVDALEKKVEDQAEEIVGLKTKMDALITENKTLREVLEGRDKATMEYQAEGMRAMKRGEQILEVVERTDQNVQRLVNGTVVETKTRKVKRI